MNTTEKYPMDQQVDRLLSAFFKAELPNPFPMMRAPAGQADLPMPVSPAPMGERHSSILKSRLSLAASVAILIGGCWYISGQMTAPAGRANIGQGDDKAQIIKQILKAKEEPKKPTMP